MKKKLNISPTAQLRSLWAGLIGSINHDHPSRWTAQIYWGSYKLRGWNPNPIHFFPFFLFLSLFSSGNTHRRWWAARNGGRPHPAPTSAAPGGPRTWQGPARSARAGRAPLQWPRWAARLGRPRTRLAAPSPWGVVPPAPGCGMATLVWGRARSGQGARPHASRVAAPALASLWAPAAGGLSAPPCGRTLRCVLTEPRSH